MFSAKSLNLLFCSYLLPLQANNSPNFLPPYFIMNPYHCRLSYFRIGIQNFPEGLAVSMPLRREGLSRGKSFWYGQLSGVVEPFAGVLGAAIVLIARPVLPYALSFAAGAMIFVVVEELIPESQRGKNTDIATLGAMLGFAVMMLLDVALG